MPGGWNLEVQTVLGDEKRLYFISNKVQRADVESLSLMVLKCLDLGGLSAVTFAKARERQAVGLLH